MATSSEKSHNDSGMGRGEQAGAGRLWPDEPSESQGSQGCAVSILGK